MATKLSAPLVVQIADAALNDSDKTLTVPAGMLYEVLLVRASLISTATAGNRLMRLIVKDDSGNELYRSSASAVQVASVTETYAWTQGDRAPAETVATEHTMPLPPQLLLPAGFAVQVLDSAGIDAAADDLTVRMLVIEHHPFD